MRQKGSKTTGRELKPGIGYTFYILCRKLFRKAIYFREQIDRCFNFFPNAPRIQSTETTVSALEYQHKLYFLKFYSKK